MTNDGDKGKHYTDGNAATVTTPVLEAHTYAHGICFQPWNAPTSEHDPWYPVTGVHEQLEVLAAEACHGCPVIPTCLEWTLRTEAEQKPGGLAGIRGGLAPHQRATLIRQRRAY